MTTGIMCSTMARTRQYPRLTRSRESPAENPSPSGRKKARGGRSVASCFERGSHFDDSDTNVLDDSKQPAVIQQEPKVVDT